MKIIVSLGDINGIGLECFYDAFCSIEESKILRNIEFTLCGNKESIVEYFEKLNKKIKFNENDFYIGTKKINLLNLPDYSPVNFGETTSESGNLSAKAVVLAADRVIAGQYDALVTLPISKEAIKLGSYDFPGHTELLSSRFQNKYQELMILFCKELVTALCTIHIPISKVPESISKEVIQRKLLVFKESLSKDFGIINPKIAVLGLNPHSGENGEIGKEEIEIIKPAIEEYEFAYGPFAADGFFAHRLDRDFNAVFAMYHDQGLIPLKILAAGSGVNFTAGLPIIRTSPDHGTAFNLAGGKGRVDFESTLNAIISAEEIYNNRLKYNN